MQMDNTNYSESSTSPMLSPELQQNFYSSPTKSVSFTSSSSPISIMMYPDSQSTTPLTPAAVSPMSTVFYDPMAQQRKFSVDIGPFGYSSQPQFFDTYRMIGNYDYHNQQQQTTTSHNIMNSAVNISQPQEQQQFNTDTIISPTANVNEQQQQSVTTSSSIATKTKQQRSSDAPAIQHKHVCKYAYCGWSFKRYEHLKRHMLVHTGERPHVCHFLGCGKSFSRSDNFHAHCRTHTKKTMIQEQQQRRSSSSRGSKPNSKNGNSIPTSCSATTNVAKPMTTAVSTTTNNMFSSFDYSTYEQHRPTSQQFPDHGNNTTLAAMSENIVFNDQQINMEPTYLSGSSPSTMSSSFSSTGISNSEYFMFPNSNNAQWGNIDCSTTTTSVPPRRASFPVTSTTASTIAQNKSHVCPVSQCQRRFKRLEHLKRHMRIHTLERPFPCSFPNCHKTFSRSDNLSQHMKTHQRHEDRRKRQLQQQQQQEKQHHMSTSQYQQPTTTMQRTNEATNSDNDAFLKMTNISNLQQQWSDVVAVTAARQ
ncbi:hypothetical protein BDC45DRAFT_541681 [Circinella umbellata]|nr:hypothetical protein BDC45DRAFT_541681 [Circinella umbellata]